MSRDVRSADVTAHAHQARPLKPPALEYHRPESLDQALALMAEHGDEAKPLAGGQSLVPLLAMRLSNPAHLVDLQGVEELRKVALEDGRLRIGAMVRQRDLERDQRTPALVAAALPHIGHFQIRNRGTVGGSLAHMDPAAEWPALALALDALLVAESIRGRRAIPATEFCKGPLMTALAPDELLTEVVLPAPRGGFGFAEVARTSGAFALAGAACQGGAVAVFGTGSRPQRLAGVERLLSKAVDPSEIEEAAAAEIEAVSDIHAPAAYRRRAGAALVRRVVVQASTGSP